MCCVYSLRTDATNNINSTRQELKTQSNTQQCVSLHTYWTKKKSSLHIIIIIRYPITKAEKCHFPCFLVCTAITDDGATEPSLVSQNIVKLCSDEYTFVVYLFAVHVFIHWSVVKYNATVFMCVCCSMETSTIYSHIYSYITKKLAFKIIFLQ